jgi:transposase InsO family protein
VNIHKNARLTVARRLELVLLAGRPGADLSALARLFGVSRRTVYKWRTRWRLGGTAALRDRSSRPRTSPTQLSARVTQRIVHRRRQRWSSCRIAEVLGLPIATVVRAQRRAGWARLPRQPQPPVQRYEWARPGDLLHVDIKKLGKVGRIGHRIHGDRRTRARGIGWEAVHVAIDDHTRWAYVEVLPDEQAGTTAGFLQRALAHFAALGVRVRRVLSDNGSAYRSHAVAAVLRTARVRHRFTRPYTPRTNGKAERFIRTLLERWAYATAYRSSGWRTRALPRIITYYNHVRPHYGLHGQTPAQRLAAALRTTS